MSLAITATIGQLKDFIARAHRAIEALEDLEKVGVIPKGVVDYNPETKPNVKVTGIMKTCKKCGHITGIVSIGLVIDLSRRDEKVSTATQQS